MLSNGFQCVWDVIRGIYSSSNRQNTSIQPTLSDSVTSKTDEPYVVGRRSNSPGRCSTVKLSESWTTNRPFPVPPTECHPHPERRPPLGCSCRVQIARECLDSDEALELFIKRSQDGITDERTVDDILCCMLEEFDAMLANRSPDDMAFRRLRRAVLKLSLWTGVLPSILFREGVICNNQAAQVGGAFADVTRGTLGDVSVALKQLRPNQRTDAIKSRKALYREALLWRLLHHPSVLPFLGLRPATDEMISPWMANGDIGTHLRNNSGMIDPALKRTWILEIASGLAYLHDSGVVHGDLHGGNIVLDGRGHARIADFGLATLVDAGQYTMQISTWRTGAVQWVAPERLKIGGRCTPEADVYSFACLCLQIVTEEYPWNNINNVWQMVAAMINEQTLRWPVTGDGKLDEVGHLMDQCWSRIPSERPKMGDVFSQLETLFSTSPR